MPAIGGISKDSMAPCFSPHHYSHARAAEFAVQVSLLGRESSDRRYAKCRFINVNETRA